MPILTESVLYCYCSVSELFNNLGCETPAVRELLGSDGVTDANLVAYLGILEQRANELLQVRFCKLHKHPWEYLELNLNLLASVTRKEEDCRWQ